jgi:Icc-related predicted phosphoesterase
MKLLYCSDLHGAQGHYARLVTVAQDRQPDVIVLGGDLLPDDSALEPARMGHGQPQFVRQQFKESMIALRQASGCRAILVIFGNHDWTSSVTAMQELQGSPRCPVGEGLITILDHKTPVEIQGLSFLGYSCTPPTPWFVKDFERLDRPGDRLPLLGGARWDQRFSRATAGRAQAIFEGCETIAEELATLRPPAGPWVFVAHAPPYETHLDRTYGRKPFGSRAVRAAIEQHQPILSLHGHIHESPVVTGHFRHEFDQTVAVNAGQTRYKLNYASIQIDVAGRKVVLVEHGQSFTGV